MAITAEQRAEVLELYTAYFNRAADAAGVDYWTNEMDVKGWSILDVASSFAQQTEYILSYVGKTNTEVINLVYQNLLGRDSDADGLAYWIGQLDAGTLEVHNLIIAVTNAATEVVNGVATNASDKTLVDNKTTVSQYYYDKGLNEISVSLASVTSTSETVTNAISVADVSVATVVKNDADAKVVVTADKVTEAQSALDAYMGTDIITIATLGAVLATAKTAAADAVTAATAAETAVVNAIDASMNVTYMITTNASSVIEGESLTYTITASDALVITPTTLTYQIGGIYHAGGTSTPNSDFEVSSGNVTIAAGETTATIILSPSNDGISEGFEGFYVALLDTSSKIVAASSNIAIRDISDAGTVKSLVVGIDNLFGTTGNDTYNAVTTKDAGSGTTILAGDVITAGDGTDTLNIFVSGASTSDVTIDQFQATSLEKIILSNFDSAVAGTANHIIDASLVSGLTLVGTSSSGVNGDTIFKNLNGSLVSAEMRSGAADLTIEYGSNPIVGSIDIQTLTISKLTAGTFTAHGIETINLHSELDASILTGLVSTSLKSLVVTGNKDLTISTGITFATSSNGSIIEGTVDASLFTGALDIKMAGNSTVSITGGIGNDTINAVDFLTTYDVIDGGAGTDKITLNATAITTQFTNVINVESIVFNKSDTAVSMNISKISSGVSSIELDVHDNNDINSLEANTVTNLTGQTVILKHTQSDASDSSDNDGLKYTITNATDTAADTIYVILDGIGSGSIGSADTNFGINELDASNFESINITSNTNSVASRNTADTADVAAVGLITLNTIDTLTVGSATDIVFTGSADLTVTTIAGGATTAVIDASAVTGKFVTTLGVASDVTVNLAVGDSIVNFAGTLNNGDSVIGGAGTDIVTNIGTTGLTITTGVLTISDVETVSLTTSGNNTLNLTGVKRADTVVVTDNVQIITGLDLSTSLTLGLTTDESATLSEIDVTALNVTGSSDILNVILENSAGTTISIIDASDIETLALTVNSASNGATLDLSTFEGTAVTLDSKATIIGTAAISLGTLHANTVSLTSTYVDKVTASFANTSSSSTFTGVGTDVQTITGSAFSDIFNIGSTSAITHVISGGAGEDTLNLTVASGFIDVGLITSVQTVNISVVAGDDISIATDFDATVDDITITGGSSTSTFDAGTINNSIETVDASSFLGNLVAIVASNSLDSTVTFSGGALSTDQVTNQITAAATTYALQSTGIEILDLDIDDDATISLATATGVTNVIVDLATAAKTGIISNITSELITLTAINAASILEAKLASSTGGSDTVSFKMGTGTLNAGAKLKTTDIETVNIEVDNAVSLDLSLITMTTPSLVSILNITGDSVLTISALNADVTTINASSNTAGLIMTARSSTAASIITGSSEADTIIMMNAADILNGTSNTSTSATDADTLDIDFAASGTLTVNLASAGDQVTTFNGTSNATVQSNFTSVDLGGYTGSFSATISAHGSGSTITGTSNADTIFLSTGSDVINFLTTNGGDSIESFSINNDKLNFDTITGINSDGVAVNAGASQITDAADSAVYVFADGASGTAGDSIDFTEADANTLLADVATFLSAGLVAATNEKYVAVINDLISDDVYIYLVQASATTSTGIEAAELTLIGRINDIGSNALDINEIA